MREHGFVCVRIEREREDYADASNQNFAGKQEECDCQEYKPDIKFKAGDERASESVSGREKVQFHVL